MAFQGNLKTMDRSSLNMTLNKVILILTVFYFSGCSKSETQYKMNDCHLKIDITKMSVEGHSINLEIALSNNGQREILLPSLRTSIGVKAFEVLTLVNGVKNKFYMKPIFGLSAHKAYEYLRIKPNGKYIQKCTLIFMEQMNKNTQHDNRLVLRAEYDQMLKIADNDISLVAIYKRELLGIDEPFSEMWYGYIKSPLARDLDFNSVGSK